MWELDYKESWAPRNWCFWTVVLEKTLESPLDCKEIQPVHPKGNQSWMLIGRTDVKVEVPIFWPPDAKSWLIWKDPDDGKDWRQEEKGMTENEMVRWHHRLNGHEFGWTPGVGDGQGVPAFCGSWCCKESDMTKGLNWTETVTELNWPVFCVLFLLNFYISCLLPYLFGVVSHSSLRSCLLGLSPQKICQIQCNSQLLGCAFFSPDIPHWLLYFVCAPAKSP